MVGYASLFTIQAMDSFGNARTTSNNIATGLEVGLLWHNGFVTIGVDRYLRNQDWAKSQRRRGF